MKEHVYIENICGKVEREENSYNFSAQIRIEILASET